FQRYEDSLVMPLPDLVPELGGYPQITRLKSILDTIDKMEQDRKPKISSSQLQDRLNKKGGSSSRDMWNPGSAKDFGTDLGKPGTGGAGGGALPPPKGGNDPKGNIENQTQTEIDHLLGRFVDCDVQPGLTYEYRIQLRMHNPNFGYDKYVANPVDAQ